MPNIGRVIAHKNRSRSIFKELGGGFPQFTRLKSIQVQFYADWIKSGGRVRGCGTSSRGWYGWLFTYHGIQGAIYGVQFCFEYDFPINHY